MCEVESLSPPKSTPHYQASISHINQGRDDIHYRCYRVDFPRIYCRCGHGFCEVKTAKNDRNSGRSYYVCPIKRGKKCRDFVKWCDKPVDETDIRPPLYKYPMCPCGAGVCRKEKEKSGPNESRYLFVCPIREGHGACSFRLWEDTLLGIRNIDGFQDIDMKNLVSWDSLKENARSILPLLTPSSPPNLSPQGHVQHHEEEDNIVRPKKHIQHYEVEKARLANVHDIYAKTKAELELSQQHSQSLQKEVCRLRAMLQKVEDQICSYERETKEMETRLGEIKASIIEAEESVKIAAEQAGTATK